MLVDINGHDNSIKPIIQLETHSVEINYFQFFKFSLFVQEEYKRGEVEKTIPNEIRNLQKRYHLKDETIIIFFKIINEEKIQITNDHYYDLFILAKHFRVESLIKILDNFANKNMDDITFLISSILDKECLCGLNNDHITEFQIDLEDKLSRKINDCLQNEHFSTLPFPTIYRIVARSSRKQIDSNILYQFISKSLEKRYMLFSFLQLDLLNSTNFTNLCSQYEKLKGSKSESIFRFLPPSLSYISQVKSQLQESNSKEINQLRNEITQLTNENHKLHEEIIELKKRIPKKIEKLQPIVKKELPKSKETSTKEEGNLTQTIPVQKQINVNVIKEILSLYQQTGSSQKPLLHIGCELGNIQIVEYIFSLGNIDINRIYYENGIPKSALYIAIEKKSVPIVQFLLGQPNIDVNANYTIQEKKTTTTKKVIHLAVEHNNVEIVGLLLNYKNIDVNDMLTITRNDEIDSKAALHIAAEKKYIDIVQQLLTHPMIDVNIAASITQNIYDSDYNKKILKPALYIAAEVNCIEIVQLLLDHPKIDINSKFSTSVDKCYTNEYEEDYYNDLNIMSEISIDNDTQEETALFLAVKTNNLDIVQLLLNNPRIDVNLGSKGKVNQTPLHKAIENHNTNITNELLQNEKINFKIQDQSGRTPIQLMNPSDISTFLSLLNQ